MRYTCNWHLTCIIRILNKSCAEISRLTVIIHSAPVYMVPVSLCVCVCVCVCVCPIVGCITFLWPAHLISPCPQRCVHVTTIVCFVLYRAYIYNNYYYGYLFPVYTPCTLYSSFPVVEFFYTFIVIL